MLAKKYRLPVRSVLGKTGLTQRSRYFLMKTFPPTKPYSRIGVVVSAKVAAKATARNALRRAVYDAIRSKVAELPQREYLILAQKGAYELLLTNGMISELRLLFKI